MFAEKLNFLMSIIGVSGGELAHAVSLDPSYISRLRSGMRTLPKGQRFLGDIAAFFATRVHTDYQIRLLRDAMSFEDPWPEDVEEAKDHIYDWLLRKESSQRVAILNVLQGAVSSFLLEAVLSPDATLDLSDFSRDAKSYYFGQQGRRDAFFQFLALALSGETQNDMLLFSSEEVDWLPSDHESVSYATSRITELAVRGGRVKIIHPVLKDITDMIRRVQCWAPVYVTGYAEPYYCEKARADFSLRTIFVVPDTVAMISCSLEGCDAEAVTTLVTEPRVVQSLTEEMSYFLSEATPLARVFTSPHHDGIEEMLGDFYAAPGDMLVIHDHLTPFPRKNEEGEAPSGIRLESLPEGFIECGAYTEVISKPCTQCVREGRIPIQLTELASDGPHYLTKESYIENLDRTISLLETHDQYRLLIVPQTFFDFYLCVKKGVGVLASKSDKNAATFYVDQQHVLDIVWDYATAVMKRVDQTDRKQVIEELKALRSELQAE